MMTVMWTGLVGFLLIVLGGAIRYLSHRPRSKPTIAPRRWQDRIRR